MLQRHTTKPQTLRFHLTHPCIELCRNNSPSHIPLLNFAGAALHITPRMCANPEPRSERISTKPQTLRFLSHTSLFWTLPNSSPYYTTHVSQPILNQRPKTHYKLQSENFHLTHPCFELCLNNSEQMTPACVPTHPEPTFQKHTTKPQTPRFSSHTSLFWTLPEQLSILHHARVPTHPEPTSQNTLQTSDPKMFISHIPVSNFAWTTRNRWHHAYVPIHPEPTSQNTLQISIRKFSSHTFLYWTLPEQLGTDYTTHVCQPWTNVAKTHHKTSDPKIFISHIPVLNFAGTALHVTQHMCANPSWRHTTKSQTPRFSSHTSLFWTLPEQLSILHHACVPTLSQRRKELPQNLRP